MKSRAERFGEAAREASVREALTTPKPGLVDAEGSGCHEDMDCALFLKSAAAIAPFWRRQAEAGFDGTPPELAMAKLRPAGIEMELAMFEATCGVNTHKGLIYLMSLLLYGCGRAAVEGERSAASASRWAAAAAAGAVARELAPIAAAGRRPMTNGERLYLEHGVTGIRGEAELGFPSVTEAGLPALREAGACGASPNDAAISSLLAIMLRCEDSNVMHRAGWHYWHGEYMTEVAAARRRFDPLSRDYRPLAELEKKFLPLRVSPGGAADLLSCTFLLDWFEKNII